MAGYNLVMTYRNLEVKPVNIAGVPGFQIQGIWRACSDSFWETVAHAAIFPTSERAERFLKRVKATPWWEWKGSGQWGVPVSHVLSNTDYIQHHAPVYCPVSFN